MEAWKKTRERRENTASISEIPAGIIVIAATQ